MDAYGVKELVELGREPCAGRQSLLRGIVSCDESVRVGHFEARVEVGRERHAGHVDRPAHHLFHNERIVSKLSGRISLYLDAAVGSFLDLLRHRLHGLSRHMFRRRLSGEAEDDRCGGCGACQGHKNKYCSEHKRKSLHEKLSLQNHVISQLIRKRCLHRQCSRTIQPSFCTVSRTV